MASAANKVVLSSSAYVVGTCVLQVVWDDSILRLFVVPTGNRPLGLLYRANKGQVDFDGAVGTAALHIGC